MFDYGYRYEKLIKGRSQFAQYQMEDCFESYVKNSSLWIQMDDSETDGIL